MKIKSYIYTVNYVLVLYDEIISVPAENKPISAFSFLEYTCFVRKAKKQKDTKKKNFYVR